MAKKSTAKKTPPKKANKKQAPKAPENQSAPATPKTEEKAPAPAPKKQGLTMEDFPPMTKVVTKAGLKGVVVSQRDWQGRGDAKGRVIVSFDGVKLPIKASDLKKLVEKKSEK